MEAQHDVNQDADQGVDNGQATLLGEFLTERGRRVTIVDSTEFLGTGMVDAVMGNLFIWFRKKGVIMIPGVKDMEITEKGLSLTNPKGEKELIVADSIIPAVELAPNTQLLDRLKGRVPEIYAIGDCQEPNLIVDAIAAGSRVARSI